MIIKSLLLFVALTSSIFAQTELATTTFRIGTTDRNVGSACPVKNFIVYNLATGKQFTCSQNSIWVEGTIAPPKTFGDLTFNGNPTLQCSTGNVGYQTDAVPGNNLWLCTSPNTWNKVAPNVSNTPPPTSGTYCLQSVNGVVAWNVCGTGNPVNNFSNWDALTGSWDSLTGTTWDALH